MLRKKDLLLSLNLKIGVFYARIVRRTRHSNIQFYFNRKEIETAERQWAKFVENTRKGIIYGEWNDNGKLL